jgi:acetolactate synthase-1/3 small subunit
MSSPAIPQPASAYFLDPSKPIAHTHVLAVVAENQPGVLARIIGLFAGRGYNIDSLTVSETEHEKHVSRFTIVTTGTDKVIEQITTQLDRMVSVHSVADLTVQGNYLARELAMVKVAGKGDKRVEALRLADAFRARVVDASTDSFVFELTGKPDKIDQFISLMVPLGLVEVARTGVAAISRGADAMKG